MERLGVAVGSSSSPTAPGTLCASLDGFSLHAQVRVAAEDRERLEHLVRYVRRPALASERLSLDERGRVLLELRHPWRDGTTHLVFEPLVFLERLAALVPHPREHLLTYHGVLAPPPGAISSCRRSPTKARASSPRACRRPILPAPKPGPRRRLIALITDPPVLRKILRHLGLPAEPPALAPPRSPPQMAFGY